MHEETHAVTRIGWLRPAMAMAVTIAIGSLLGTTVG